ncbi:hypothetical protein D3I60_15780 [Brevibacterium permense]|nr:hypothetical protein [Brevibacterium permense]
MGFMMRRAASRMLVTSAAQLSTELPIRERLSACPVIVNEHITCGAEAEQLSRAPDVADRSSYRRCTELCGVRWAACRAVGECRLSQGERSAVT